LKVSGISDTVLSPPATAHDWPALGSMIRMFATPGFELGIVVPPDASTQACMAPFPSGTEAAAKAAPPPSAPTATRVAARALRPIQLCIPARPHTVQRS
jgi:hypothetical protein